jgi:flavin-dependent dehydrogenase
MYDVIVVGARVAGSPLAMLLARGGYRVLVVDRDTFPSDTLSGHYIHQAGVERLARWGLLERVAATGCPPARSVMLDFGEFRLKGSPPPINGVDAAYGPRRIVLDKILVDAAAEAGAEVREGFSVREVLEENGRVVGIRGREKNGALVTERARLVVGADGMHSLVSRAVGAAEYSAHPALTCGYYSYWSGLAAEGMELYPRDGRFLVAMPTNDNLTLVAAIWPRAAFHRYRADIEGNFLKTLELAPGLAARVHRGRREERFAGTADTPNFFRRSHGPGWALVGDAGYHKDPITGQGITDAFRDAELLAQAIDAGFAGCVPLEDALAGYERRRNTAAMPIYEMTCQMATLQPPPPETQKLLAALAGNQAETDRYLGTMAGTVPIPEFFAPQNVRRILAGAGGVTGGSGAAEVEARGGVFSPAELVPA